MLACLIAASALFAGQPVFFTPEKIESHIAAYDDEEIGEIRQDLEVVREICFKRALSPTDRKPVYLATAGGPGSRKTTILERFLASHADFHPAYVDPDQRGLRFMVHTYGKWLSAYFIAQSTDYTEVLKHAYEKWRGASNMITLTLLEEAFSQKLDIAHGTTNTGGHISSFLPAVKQAGYDIVLLLCSSKHDLKREAIAYRNDVIRFYQSTPEDAVSKAKFFSERMPLYFQYADTLYLFWSDELFAPERLAAIVQNGNLEIMDEEAFDRFRNQYEDDRRLLESEGKFLPPFNSCISVGSPPDGR